LAFEIHLARPGSSVHLDRVASRHLRRVLVFDSLPHLCLHTGISRFAVFHRDRYWDAGGARDPVADAHLERPFRISRCRRERPDIRLPRRAGRIALVPDCASAAAWAGSFGRFCLGIVNAAVALWGTFLFKGQLRSPQPLRVACIAVLALLCAGMAGAKHVIAAADDSLYADEVIFAKDTRYQRIVLTRWRDDTRLISELASAIQFTR